MFIIYGMPNCVWCDRAKALLKLNDLDFDYRDITLPEYYQEYQCHWPNERKVPRIYDWVYDFRVGGYEQLRDYLK